jgi:hypothetical protein
MTKARSNAVANAAKGDLTVGNGTNLSGILAVGSNGDTLVADSSTATGLSYQANFAAGKNKIINGDFGIWQRGTSFSTSGISEVYCADRFFLSCDAGSGTVTQQTFTTGTAPVTGYEGRFFLQYATTVSGTSSLYIVQKIEDVRTFAGQTVTLSYWAKTSSGTVTNNPLYVQEFGAGGSGAVATSFGSSATVTTSWQRFSHTVAIPSISGKTIGTNSSLQIQVLRFAATATVQLWGVQVEAGSVATAFQTATGTIQGELAACQRYYAVMDGRFGFSGTVTSTLQYVAFGFFPVPARTTSPTVTLTSIATSGFPGAGTVASVGSTGFQNNQTANGTGNGFFINTATMSNEL